MIVYLDEGASHNIHVRVRGKHFVSLYVLMRARARMSIATGGQPQVAKNNGSSDLQLHLQICRLPASADKAALAF